MLRENFRRSTGSLSIARAMVPASRACSTVGAPVAGDTADSVEPSPFDEELEQPAATITRINAPAPRMA
jgi:hypothetical protein